MSWPTKRLTECVRFLSGGTPNKAKSEYWSGDIPWVSSAEMTDRFLSDTSLKISVAGLEAGSRLVPEGTTFAVVRGMSLAKEFRISLAQRPMAFNQDVKALIPEPGIDGLFIFYSLSAHANSIRELATEAAHGTKKLEMSRLENYMIHVPDDIDLQRVVASVAFTYDDLIATNQRRIALLEEAARRIYREWFVSLRFPAHESVSVKGGVPEGWSKTPIAEQSSFLNRGITPKYDDTAKGWVINQKCIRDGRISMEPARRQSKDVKPERLVREGDVLINSTGAGTLGRVAQVRAPIENCTVDTHVTIARPFDEISSTYFGQALLELAPTFSAMGKGATNQLELSRADIGAVEIWQPPQHLVIEFDRLIAPMLEQAEQLGSANLSLIEARDLLLPKLMSGQLDVSGIQLPDEVVV
ncbi:restriction endonuclease subunit S [Aeromonas sanarellii]